MEINDTITKIEMVNDEERSSSKEPTVEVEAQDVKVKGPTPENESTLVNSRLEARSMSRTSSPFIPLEVHPPISRNDEVSTLKKPSSRVIKNHLCSNIIGSLNEGLHLRKRNYSAYITIAPVQPSDDLSVLVEKLGQHTELESMGIVEESNDKEDKGTVGLQETYNSLFEKTGEYAKVAKTTIKKMKRAKEDYRSFLVRYKETKCEMETLNGELTEAYSKIKFLEIEVVQANSKVERVSSKKLDEVLAHQKPFSDRSGLGCTGESSLVVNISKEMKFVKAKEPVVETLVVEKVKPEKKRNVTNQRFLTKPPNQLVVKPKGKGKSLPKSQRGSRTQHFYHQCGIPGHIKPNCHKLQALKNSNA